MNITLIKDKFGVTKPCEFQFDGKLLDWLIEYFGEDGPDRKITIYKSSNGELVEVGKTYNELNQTYSDIVIMQNPAGVELLWIAYAVLVVASFVLIKPPRLQNQSEGSDRKSSPNNGLDGQTNLARRLQRIPEMFGKNKSYPDLIAESVFKYVNQVKIQTEVFSIGRGYYELEEFKSGDTLIDSIPEANLEIFEPFETIPNFEKVEVSTSVLNQQLVAPNEQFVENQGRADDWKAKYDSVNDVATLKDDGFPTAFDFLTSGDEAIVQDLVIDVTGGIGGGIPVSGTYVVNVVSQNTIELLDAATVNSSWTSIPDEYKPAANDAAEVILDELQTIGPFVVPGENYSKILIDIEAPQGLASGSALTEFIKVLYSIRVESVDASGVPDGVTDFTLNKSVEGRSTTPKFFTIEIESGITAGSNYRVSITRTSDALIEVVSAETLRWTRLASSKLIDGSDLVGTTRARLTVQATEQTINIQDRKFNCIATRKCATWNGSTIVGNLQTGVGLVASQKFADALLTYFIDPKLANKNSNLLNIESLYNIQDNLPVLKGQFNFTFDSDSSSAQEELFTIADACRCFITKTGAYHDITRDEKQNSPKRLINRALKKPNSERKTISFNRETSNDGVELTYLDFDADERRTIILPDMLPSGDDLYSSPATQNPLKIDAIGITNYTQAWDRAQYEWRRLVFKRSSVNVTTGASIGTLPLNSRIEYSDGTLPANIVGKSDGYVKAVNGTAITTSEECEFIDGVDHEVFLTTEDGETQGPYLVAPIAHTFGFNLLETPESAIYARGGANNYQRGTCYTFRAISYQTNAMMLQRKTPSDGFYFDCELINYSDEYYAADEQTPP